MPDTPAPASPTLLDKLVKASADLIRAKLDEDPLSPHAFDEISIAAKAIHKACTALDPVLNLPTRAGTALAPAPQTEGYGSAMARELIASFQNLGAGGGGSRQSRKDLMSAIVVAEKAGFAEDAERLRAELYDDDEPEVDDDLLPPKRKVDLAKELIKESDANTKRAQVLLASVKPEQVIDAESWDPRLKVNCVVRLDGRKQVVRDPSHLKECIEAGAGFVCERPHADEDFSYTCNLPNCRCSA